MKILVAGSDKVFAIEVLYVKYLREAGVDVQHFAGQSMFYDYYQAGIFNKLMFRSGLSGIYRRINDAFRKSVLEHRPDIIWIFKGMEITPASIQWAKSLGCKLVNYNPDSPLLFSGKGSGNKNVTDSIGLFDLYLSYDRDLIAAIAEQFNVTTDLLPFGFDISDEILQEAQSQAEINKACFLGNPDKDRAAFIKLLASAGIEIDVYGNNWDAFIQHPAVKAHPAVYRNDYWKTLYRYRVQLNLMRPHNPGSHNMRTFELGGIGGIQLAPDTIDHTTYFEPGKEIFIYHDVNDCIKKIETIRSMPKHEADAVRENTRRRSIGSAYSYKDRTQQAIEIFHRHFPGIKPTAPISKGQPAGSIA